MADTQNTDKVDILHPLATIHWKQCHKWEDYYPTHCSLLHDKLAILTEKTGYYDVLHMSSMDLHSWTTTTLSYSSMGLATYKSQFVLVGGHCLSKVSVDVVLTSDAGLEWQPSLPPMMTKRYNTTCISTRSQQELIVAGGVGDDVRVLDVVEVLIDNNWHKAHPLPEPCGRTRATLHQDKVVFTDRYSERIYSCSIASLLLSCAQTNTCTPIWTEIEAPDICTTTISYSSRLVNLDRYSVIRGYCSRSQSWVVVYWPDREIVDIRRTAATLPTGDIVVAGVNGVYRVKVSVSSYDPDKEFQSDILSRLEEVMGIKIMSVLGNNHSQLTTSSGVKLQTVYRWGREMVLPDQQSDPVLYVEEVIIQWSMRRSHRPPTWKQLLEVLQDMGLRELSQQIEAFMTGDYKFQYAYKHFIDSKDVLELLCLKFMFLGPPRLGKSTTRRRVMKEIVDLQSAEEAEQVHGSTGAVECCPNMLVQDASDSANPESGADWTIVQSLTEEACLLFHSLKDSLKAESVPEAATNSHVGTKTIAEVSQASSTEQSRHVEKTQQPKLLQKMMTKIKKSLTKSKQSAPEHSPTLSQTHAESVRDIVTSSDYSEIAAIFNEVSQQPQFERDVKHSFKAYLRMEDTGGQPELMDMLPALTIGPGLYLLFFSYEFKLEEEYQVFYQRNSGEKSIPEKSEFTLQEMLLCTLASISCSSASTHAQPMADTDNPEVSEILKSSKSVVYIVGTHKDKVSDEYIAAFDEKLQSIIRDTDFYRKGIVQYCSENKLVVSLDNMGGGIEEINQLHQLLESAMENHFKKLKIPAVWLLFSLCLRMRDVRTASMETCLALASAFNMSSYETKTAMWFLHHHAGVMMYFPNIAGLEDLVIIDIQVVYDSITSVILKAVRFDAVNHSIAEKFRKTGRFTIKELKLATTTISGDLIPPNQLVALLEYLHIIAQILSDDSCVAAVSEDDKEHIMPCVLENTSLKELDLFHKESSRSCIVFPLFVYFTCGFTPMGLFSSLMACLISNKSFTFVREGIKKNMVHYLYGSKQVDVTFISRSTSYEVVVSCDSAFHDSIHRECAALKQEIENVLKKASSRMNYSSYMDYRFAFECYSHDGENHLGVVYGVESIPSVMTRINNPKGVALQNRHLIWYGQEYVQQHESVTSESGNYLRVFLSVLPELVISVKPCVMSVADHCFSIGLISEDTYDQLVQRVDLVDKQKARILLGDIRTVLSSTPTALKQFVSVLFQSGECNQVAENIQKQLQVSK